jgi:glycosyltransferase involved in cell wall biosynthesis
MDESTDGAPKRHTISVVIPVYQGERTLGSVVEEIIAVGDSISPDGTPFRVSEIVLVYDNGRDLSDEVIRELESTHEIVRSVWLSRNFGQHAATLAGMASSSGDWVVTMDEDGQHNPRDMGVMLDSAVRNRAQVVYAHPTNEAPHGALRNAASKGAKRLVNRTFASENASNFNSYRLILGSVARGVAAYAGSGVYLDVALGWVAGRYASAPTELRGETRRSGYTTRRLFGHFWRMVLTSGTRGLRLVSILGVFFAVLGILIAIYIVVLKLTSGIDAQGWASTVTILLVVAGAILFSLGVIAEYIGVSVNMALGKPAYLITSDPADGPLARVSSRKE